MPVIEFDEPTHRYTVDGVVTPSVTQILEAAGISDFSGVPADVLARAAARGTAVHQAAWFLDQDDLDESTVDPAIVGYLDAWKRFREVTGATMLAIEERVASSLGFAGTFDRLADIPKVGRTLIDIKTGCKSPSWPIQLAAYTYARFGKAQSAAVRRMVVALHDDGRYDMQIYPQATLARDWNVFAGALAVFQYRKESGLI